MTATTLRTTPDRIRHTLMFEAIGLVLLVSGAWAITGYGLELLGIVGLVSSLIATVWNYIYNLLFDRAMLRIRGDLTKTHAIRALHALLFEAGLLVILLPFVAWMLSLSLWQAFLFDLAVAIFYVIYGYLFNWAYDRAFPLKTGPDASVQEPSA